MARRRSLAVAAPRRGCRSGHLYPLPVLASLLFHSRLRRWYWYTWLVADGLATGAVLAALARGPWGTRVRMWRVTGILFAASLIMFGAGYPFGIFRAGRFLGLTLRETALNLFLQGRLPWRY